MNKFTVTNQLIRNHVTIESAETLQQALNQAQQENGEHNKHTVGEQWFIASIENEDGDIVWEPGEDICPMCENFGMKSFISGEYRFAMCRDIYGCRHTEATK